MKLSDLINQPILHGQDGEPVGRIEDVMIDLVRRRVAFARVDLGGQWSYAPFLLHWPRLSCIGTSLRVGGPWRLWRRARAIAATRASVPTRMTDIAPPSAGALDVHSSPMFMSGLLDALWRRERLTGRIASGTSDKTTLFWGRDLKGKTVFDDTGPLGEIVDLRIDGGEGVVISLLVGSPGAGPLISVNAEALRHIPVKGGHLVAAGRPDKLGARVHSAEPHD